MLYLFRIFLIISLYITTAFGQSVSEKTDYINILPKSQIFIDYSQKDDIKSVINREFKDINRSFLNFGYSPRFNVWIKFELRNSTSKDIVKIIEYRNPLTSYIELFDGNHLIAKDGLLNHNANRDALNPYFTIKIPKNSYKTYYIKAASVTTPLIINLHLWSEKAFYKKEIKESLVLGIFIGALLILIIYNLVIFFKTKERLFLYYMGAFLIVLIHHLIYRGFAPVILNKESVAILIDFASVITTLPLIFLALFTSNILHFDKNANLNRFVTVNLLFALPLAYILQLLNNSYRSGVAIYLVLLFLIFSIYALYQKKRYSFVITVSWILFALSSILMYLSSKGVLNMYSFNSHLIEVSLFIEAILYATILSKKYSLFKLNYQKAASHLLSKHNKYQVLKTLHKEYKHKMNNLLEKLQNRTSSQEITMHSLQEAIVGINKTIMLFYKLEELESGKKINFYNYLQELIESLFKLYTKPKLNFTLDIDPNIELSKEVYETCINIITEAIINAGKYAYPNKDKGNIFISFGKFRDKYTLKIKDFGIGFKQTPKNGLLIIENLVKFNLEGSVAIESENGVEIVIKWKE